MGLGTIIASAVTGLAAPISEAYQKRQDRLQAKEAGEAKIIAAKVEGNKEITLTDQEWEAIAVGKSDSTWKDEYVTVIITLPFPLLIFGGIWEAITGDSSILRGTVAGIQAIAELGIDLGAAMTMVIAAAVGLKVLKNTLR